MEVSLFFPRVSLLTITYLSVQTKNNAEFENEPITLFITRPSDIVSVRKWYRNEAYAQRTELSLPLPAMHVDLHLNTCYFIIL